MIVFCLVMCLFITLGSVSATIVDDNSTQVEISTGTDLVSVGTLGVSDEMSSSAENTSVLGSSDEDKLSLSPSNGVLTATDEIGTQDDFTNEISGQNYVVLKYKNYTFTSSVNLHSNLIIDGNGTTITKNYDVDDALLMVSDGLENLTIKNIYIDMNYIRGHAFGQPSANNIYTNDVYRNLMLENVTFANLGKLDTRLSKSDIASTHGSAILLRSYNCTNVTIHNCQFINSHVTAAGAINIIGENHTIDDCTFRNCYSPYNAGGIEIFAPNSIINNCKFYNCTAGKNVQSGAQGLGGAIILYARAHDINITNCYFEDCESTRGGAIALFQTSNYRCYILNCTFVNCSSTESGGAVHFNAENSTLENCSFTNCSSDKGGAVFSSALNSVVIKCNFTNNTANDGMDFYTSSTGTIKFEGLEFTELYVTNNPHAGGVANGKGTSRSLPAYWGDDTENLIKKFLKWQVGETTIYIHTNKQLPPMDSLND